MKLTNSTCADSDSGASERVITGLANSWIIVTTGWASGTGNSGKGSGVVTGLGSSAFGVVDSILATNFLSVDKSSSKAVGATFSERVGTVAGA